MVDNKPVFFLLLVDNDDVNDGRFGPLLLGDIDLLSCSISDLFCLFVNKFGCIIKSSEFKLDPDN
jgi:hypothetical protein